MKRRAFLELLGAAMPLFESSSRANAESSKDEPSDIQTSDCVLTYLLWDNNSDAIGPVQKRRLISKDHANRMLDALLVAGHDMQGLRDLVGERRGGIPD